MAIGDWLRLQGMDQVARRFPVPVSFAVVTLGLCLLAVHHDFPDGAAWIVHAISAGIFGFFVFVAETLYNETADTARRVSLLTASVVFLGYITVFMPDSGEYYNSAGLLWIAASLLCLTALPFRQEKQEAAYWQFSYKVFIGVLTGILAALIWFLGMAAAIAAINHLFEVDIDDALYADIWLFSACILGPFYALSHVPSAHGTSGEQDIAPVPVFILNWILAPLVIGYMVILYAYFAKIAVTWELPRGQLAHLTAGFCIAGIITYMGAWLLQTRAQYFLTFLKTYFFALLPLPVLMLFLAIGWRVEEYGVTEERYFILLCGVWLLVCAGAGLARKLDLRLIPLLLAFLLIIASFGPGSAFRVSFHSQWQRLMHYNDAYQFYDAQNVRLIDGDVAYDDKREIGAILHYLLNDDRRREKLQDRWPALASYAGKPVDDILDKMGIGYISAHAARNNRITKNRLSLDVGEEPWVKDVKGYQYYADFHAFLSFKEQSETTISLLPGTPQSLDFVIHITPEQITVSQNGAPLFKFSLSDQVPRVQKGMPLIWEQSAQNGRNKARVVITRLEGDIVDGALRAEQVGGYILINIP